MNPFNLGIIIGLWIGLYLLYRFIINQKTNSSTNQHNQDISPLAFQKDSNFELVRDLSQISESLNQCIESIIFIDQSQGKDHESKTVSYHDEILTQQMLKLDKITNPDLKPIRRETIRTLQRTLDRLDQLGFN